jgi:hypothetical protein
MVEVEMTDEEQQITDAFMRDFEDLLRRYNAQFDLIPGDDYYVDATAEIDFNGIYDYEKDKLVRSYINFQLPNHINPNR